MIRLHRRKEAEDVADRIEQTLKLLVVAHEVERYETPKEAPRSLPFIEEGQKKKVIAGKEELEEWLDDLEKELTWQRSLTGDACYIDPETGEIC